MNSRQPGVDLCHHCRRPMRPFNTKPADYPGTLYRSSKTTCGSCKNGLRKGTGPVTAGRFRAGMRCKGCGHKLRAYGTSGKANPDTLPHSKDGRCRPCAKMYDHELAVARATLAGEPLPIRKSTGPGQRLVAMTPPPANMDRKTKRDREALDAYIAGRRSRGIPAEGLSVEEWTKRTKVEPWATVS